jgi:hypothetical protein
MVGLHPGATQQELQKEFDRCTTGMEREVVWALPCKTICPVDSTTALINLARIIIEAGHASPSALDLSASKVQEHVHMRLSFPVGD